MNGNIHRDSTTATVTLDLLPIREAYEWKPAVPAAAAAVFKTLSCFQFVKRMNGNDLAQTYPTPANCLGLASNSWSVWMETNITSNQWYHFRASCFQFVKRMNGNDLFQLGGELGIGLLPIREAYEWKRSEFILKTNINYLASNSWSVWMETLQLPTVLAQLPVLASNSWSVWMETKNKTKTKARSEFILLPIREAYEWKLNGKEKMFAVGFLLPIREAYEWKRQIALRKLRLNSLLLASNSWSVWMETLVAKVRKHQLKLGYLLPIREAYEWKLTSDV